jgi:hypothetical protein
VASASYLIQVATPTATPAAGTVAAGTTVTLACTTSRAVIHYTLDGSDPTTSSPVASAPIPIPHTLTLTARGFRTGCTTSAALSATYTVPVVVVATPTMTPAPGTFDHSVAVTLASTTPGAVIHYTVDGSVPSATSPTYGTPITVATTTTLNAIATLSGDTPSAVATGAYTLMADAPTITPPGGTFSAPTPVTLATTTAGATVRFTTDGSNPATSATAQAATGPVTVAQSEVITAVAIMTGWSPSPAASATFVLQAGIPAITPVSGTYAGPLTVTLAPGTAGGQVLYTVDGSSPATSATAQTYSTPLSLTASTTVQAVTVVSGWSTSAVASANYQIRAAAPTFTPAGGTSADTVGVALASATPGAVITFTTDGSDPAISGTAQTYTGPISVATNETISARSSAPGYAQSLESQSSYIILVAAPTITPPAGSYDHALTISLASATSGAVLHYTLDGSTPTASSATYSAPFLLATSASVSAIAVRAGCTPSAVTSAVFTLTDDPPGIAPPSGTYPGPLTITLTPGTAGGQVLYTLDGSAPATSSTAKVASGPVSIASSTTVNAITTLAGWTSSAVAQATYQIQASTPTIAPNGGTSSDTLTATISSATPGALIGYTTDGSDPATSPTVARVASPVSITVSANETVIALTTAPGYATSSEAQATFVIQVATPIATPAGGSYSTTKQVVLCTTTSGATIRYTLDGSNPTTASTTATGPVAIAQSSTLTARAFRSGCTTSAALVAVYTLQTPAPTIAPAGGTFGDSLTATLSITSAGAILYYTLDGSTPTLTSPSGSSPLAIPITKNETLTAIAAVPGWSISPAATATFSIKVAAPTFTPTAGTYSQPVALQFASATSGAVIHYTVDGSVPTAASPIAPTAPASLTITSSATLSAIALRAGCTPSAVTTATYTIQLPLAATPAFAPPTGTYASTQAVTISSTTPTSSITYTTDGSNPATSATAVTAVSPVVVTVAQPQTITAIATAAGFQASGQASAAYQFQPAAPTITPSGGSFANATTATIVGGAGTQIYYTLDGSTPTAASSGGASPLTVAVTQNETLTAIATVAGWLPSASTSATFSFQVAPVVLTSGGTFSGSATVSASTTTTGAILYYTTDGTIPTTSSSTFSSPLTVFQTTTITIVGMLTGYAPSPAVTATYTIQTLSLASAPTYAPPAGTYATPQSVIIASTTPGATITYTTDGSNPATSGTAQSGASPLPLTVAQSETVNAIATASGYQASPQAVAAYVIQAQAATAAPTFTPPAGMYGAAQSVVIASTTPGAAISYTTDGSDPSISPTAQIASGPVTVSTSEVIEAIAQVPGGPSSLISSAAYALVASVPTITPNGGIYNNPIWVTLSNDTDQSDIYYTLDGSNPTSASTGGRAQFSLQLASTCTLTAQTFKSGWTPSALATQAFTFQAALPGLSPVSGTYSDPLTVTAQSATSGAILYYTTDGTTPTTSSAILSSSLSLNANATVSVIAVRTGFAPSAVAQATYMVNTLPQMSFTTASSSVPGNGGADVVSISLNEPSSVDVQVTLTLSGSALLNENYTASLTPANSEVYSGMVLTIPAGSTGVSISLNSIGGPEGGEGGGGTAIVLTLSQPTQAILGAIPQHQATIVVPTQVGFPQSYFTVNEDTGTAYLAVVLSQPMTVPVTVQYAATNGTAINGQDFTVNPGTLTFAPGQTALSIPVTIVFGSQFASDTYFSMQLSNPTNAQLANSYPMSSEASIEIANVNGPPVITPGTGTYPYQPIVTISTNAGSGAIMYTLDGSVPTMNSLLYSTPITITAPCTLTAALFRSGLPPTLTASAVYTLQVPVPALPYFTTASNQPLSIHPTSSLTGVTYWYTLDGSTPSSSSPTTAGPILLTQSATLTVIGVLAGYLPSAPNSMSYTLRASSPTFSPSGGTYNQPISVSVASASPGATISYTVDGSIPTSTSPTWTEPITLSQNTTLTAVAASTGWTASQPIAANYSFQVATPIFSTMSLSGGFSDVVGVSVTSATPGAVLYYTLDGSTPNQGSPILTGSLNLTSTTTVTVIGYYGSFAPSAIAQQTFTVVSDNLVDPAIAFSAPSGAGDSSVSTVQIPVVLSYVSSQVVTIDYTVLSSSTAGATDYQLTPGTLMIPPGSETGSIILTVNEHVLPEPDVTVIVQLTDPLNAILGSQNTFTYTIRNDILPAPVVQYSSASASVADLYGTVPLGLNITSLQAALQAPPAGMTSTGILDTSLFHAQVQADQSGAPSATVGLSFIDIYGHVGPATTVTTVFAQTGGAAVTTGDVTTIPPSTPSVTLTIDPGSLTGDMTGTMNGQQVNFTNLGDSASDAIQVDVSTGDLDVGMIQEIDIISSDGQTATVMGASGSASFIFAEGQITLSATAIAVNGNQSSFGLTDQSTILVVCRTPPRLVYTSPPSFWLSPQTPDVLPTSHGITYSGGIPTPTAPTTIYLNGNSDSDNQALRTQQSWYCYNCSRFFVVAYVHDATGGLQVGSNVTAQPFFADTTGASIPLTVSQTTGSDQQVTSFIVSGFSQVPSGNFATLQFQNVVDRAGNAMTSARDITINCVTSIDPNLSRNAGGGNIYGEAEQPGASQATVGSSPSRIAYNLNFPEVWQGSAMGESHRALTTYSDSYWIIPNPVATDGFDQPTAQSFTVRDIAGNTINNVQTYFDPLGIGASGDYADVLINRVGSTAFYNFDDTGTMPNGSTKILIGDSNGEPSDTYEIPFTVSSNPGDYWFSFTYPVGIADATSNYTSMTAEPLGRQQPTNPSTFFETSDDEGDITRFANAIFAPMYPGADGINRHCRPAILTVPPSWVANPPNQTFIVHDTGFAQTSVGATNFFLKWATTNFTSPVNYIPTMIDDVTASASVGLVRPLGPMDQSLMVGSQAVNYSCYNSKLDFEEYENFGPRWINIVGLENDVVVTGTKAVIKIVGNFLDGSFGPGGFVNTADYVHFVDGNGNDLTMTNAQYTANPAQNGLSQSIAVVRQKFIMNPPFSSQFQVLELELAIGDALPAGLVSLDVNMGDVHFKGPTPGYENANAQNPDPAQGANGAYRMQGVMDVVQIQFVTKGKNGELLPQNFSYNATPAPAIDVSVSGASVSSSGTITMTLSGQVTDRVSDLVNDPSKQLQSLSIYSSNSQVGSVSLSNSASPELPWKPYKFVAPFSQQISIPSSGIGATTVTLTTGMNVAGETASVEVPINVGPLLSSRTFNIQIPSTGNGLAPNAIYFYAGPERSVTTADLLNETGPSTSLYAGNLSWSSVQVVVNQWPNSQDNNLYATVYFIYSNGFTDSISSSPITFTETDTSNSTFSYSQVIQQGMPLTGGQLTLVLPNNYNPSIKNIVGFYTGNGLSESTNSVAIETSPGSLVFTGTSSWGLTTVAIPKFSSQIFQTGAIQAAWTFVSPEGITSALNVSMVQSSPNSTYFSTTLGPVSLAVQVDTSAVYHGGGAGTFFPSIIRFNDVMATDPTIITATTFGSNWTTNIMNFGDGNFMYIVDPNGNPVVFCPSAHAHTHIQTKILGGQFFTVTFGIPNRANASYTNGGSISIIKSIEMLHGLVVLRDDVLIPYVNKYTSNSNEPYFHNGVTSLFYGSPASPILAYNYIRGQGFAQNGTDVTTEIIWRYVGLDNAVAVFKNQSELSNDIKYRTTIIANARNVHWGFSGNFPETWNPAVGWIPNYPMVLNSGASISKALSDLFTEPYTETGPQNTQIYKYETACNHARTACAIYAASQVLTQENFNAVAGRFLTPVGKNFGFNLENMFLGKESVKNGNGEIVGPTGPFDSYNQENPYYWIPGDVGFLRNNSFNPKNDGAAAAGENIIYLGGMENLGNFSTNAADFVANGYFFAHTGKFDANIKKFAAWLDIVFDMGGTRTRQPGDLTVDPTRYYLRQTGSEYQ